MPVYKYTCATCGDFEEMVPMARFADPCDCPTCGAISPRALTMPQISMVSAHNRRAHGINERSSDRPNRAKANGLDVTAGTSIHHLTLTDEDADDYRTFFKVKPPLRAEEDRQAVLAALRDGTIDLISSMHTPQDEESKRLPFEEAASGAVALETLLPAAMGLYHAGDLT